MGVDERGIEEDRHLEGINGVLEQRLVEVAAREVVVRVCEARLQLDRLEVELDGGVDVSELSEHVAHI